ncbi:hypothetical protein EXIGLDRAFT_49914 [Exidia glandulosa HHB12029]|uniref:Uncharacterized protein n=1 Tax=Exidia glandulosa HHB12029 TaxID=1314781 RepID=A0A165IGA6_EXIGL|nr:hypothetical protein EXIGLDRAFT_49914 [Exidia glandulosa HHB12029]
MRSAAILLAVAISASAAPLPHKEHHTQEQATTPVNPKLDVLKKNMVWQHRHYAPAQKSTAPAKRAPAPEPYTHRHYEAVGANAKRAPAPKPAADPYTHRHYDAVGANAALKKRQEEHTAKVHDYWNNRHFEVGVDANAAAAEHEHWSHSGTWTHTHTGTWAHEHTRGAHNHHHTGSFPVPTGHATETGGAPGTYPTGAPCWNFPFPHGLPEGATPTSWEWSTSWVLPTGVPADGQDWPFPWPQCPPGQGEGGNGPTGPTPAPPAETPAPTSTTDGPPPATDLPAPPATVEPVPTESSEPAPAPTETEQPAPIPTESSTEAPRQPRLRLRLPR